MTRGLARLAGWWGAVVRCIKQRIYFIACPPRNYIRENEIFAELVILSENKCLEYSVMKMHNMTSQVFRETTGAVISDGFTDKHADMQTDKVIFMGCFTPQNITYHPF